jgi:HSP20 family protein
MSLFPRFTQEFSPLFRLVDDYDRATRHLANTWSSSLQHFQPKFDVTETQTSYELNGELPGIDQKDVSIEWTDGNTLAISGRTEKYHEEGQAPTESSAEETASGALQAAPEAEAEATASDSASIDSGSNYHKPSVAEEGADEASTVADDNANAAQLTPATTNAGEVAKPAPSQAKYWVSERTVGQFHRSFSFPTRVDHDAVKASLKNGILSIVVPKAKAVQPRRIQIE